MDGSAKRDMAGSAFHRIFHGSVYIGIFPAGIFFPEALVATRALHLLDLQQAIQLILIGFAKRGFRPFRCQGFHFVPLFRSESPIIPVLAMAGAQPYRPHIFRELSQGNIIYLQDIGMAAKAFVAHHGR
jgi:hypothetical protein